ncbi:MAG: helix-turn-helix transcriptional regulator [Planctomycetota bacterium]|jgi:methylphosphotriester-DNA--protein-cysteine methyltransferase
MIQGFVGSWHYFCRFSFQVFGRQKRFLEEEILVRFVHYCKRITSMTALEYLSQCRVNKARELLNEKPDMNVLDIAMACGFESSQYFATVFKKKTGQTPSQYRQRPA